MNIIFFGSDDFAAKNLTALLDSRHDVVACVTQPDKAKGRHLNIATSPIKDIALDAGIPVLQPSNLKDMDFVKKIRAYSADIFVVIAYGRILPGDILSAPKQYCINVHASLLPKYRGAAPINWAIINGEKFTGNTIIRMNTVMDAGAILSQAREDIRPDDTSAALRARMAVSGSALLLKTLAAIEKGNVSFTKQDEKAVTFAPKLTRELGLIDWTKKAEEIYNLVRGLQPWPCAYTQFKGKMLKILEAEVLPGVAEKPIRPGTVLETGKEGFVVAAGSGALRVLKVHLQDAKAMDAGSFLIGHKIQPGQQITSA